MKTFLIIGSCGLACLATGMVWAGCAMLVAAGVAALLSGK